MKRPPKDPTERLPPSPHEGFEDETEVSASRILAPGSGPNDTSADEGGSFDEEPFDAEGLDAGSIEVVFDELGLGELEVSDEVTNPNARLPEAEEPTPILSRAGRVDPWGSTQLARRAGLEEPIGRPIGGVAPTRLLELPEGEGGAGAAGEPGAPAGPAPGTASAPLLAPPQELERTLAELGVLLKYGHHAQVRQLLERLRRAFPEDTHMHDRLVDFHLAHGQHEEAISACFAVARACFEQRRIPGFAAALERVLRIDPENARAHKLLRLIRRPR